MNEDKQFDFLIREKINSLEQKIDYGEQEEGLWNKIESRRPQKQGIKQITLWIGGIAASLALLAVIYFYPSNPHITFSKSRYVIAELGLEDQTEFEWAEELISSQCVQDRDICLSPGFLELKEELGLIENEISDLQNMISQYGAGEFIIKSKIKIENHKSEITFRMVQMLIS